MSSIWYNLWNLPLICNLQAEDWIKALQSVVYGINHEALANGSMIPEVSQSFD